MSERPTALVTGGAKRIGAAIVRDLAAHGFAVAIHANRSAGEANALAAEIEAGGGRAAVVRGDLADADAVARIVPEAVAAIGPLTLLVNNASVFLKDRYGGLDIGVWQIPIRHQSPRAGLPCRSLRRAAPEGSDGNIVNMIDQRVLKLTPEMPSYTLTKAALWTATQTLAQALAPRIRVNGIGPGPTFPNPYADDRSMTKEVAGIALKRPVDPADFGRAIRFLVETPSITGQLLLARFRPAHRMGDARHRGTAVVKEVRDSVLTAVPADPPEPRRAASDIPPLAEDVGPEAAPRLDLDWEAAAPAMPGAEVIAAAVKNLPNAPGVYRMIDEKGDVLYVGKARSLKKRVVSYARLAGQSGRIARMIRATVTMDFVRTRTETEALLLEANLIKRLRPRFNVLFRDDKSFPYILIAEDHDAPAIMKHRGARRRKGSYFGPFASAGAVGRTVNTLQRAFLIRTCSDAVYASRTRPCLLYQIKRCSAPCTGEIALDDYRRLVGEAKAFLSGESRQVRAELAEAMEQASAELDFERAALYRDRLAALSHIQSHQGINPQGVEEADVVAVHQDGGYWSIQVFFFRTGQNWGNRAYFPKADRSLDAAAVLEAFLAQFYDDKPAPRLILVSDDFPERALLEAALSERAGHRIAIAVPQRGREARARRACRRQCARGAGAQDRRHVKPGAASRRPRRSFRARGAARARRGLRQQPRHGHERGRRDDRRRAGRLRQEPLSQVQHPRRRHRAGRRHRHDARGDAPPLRAAPEGGRAARRGEGRERRARPWPDLVLIDGGKAQLGAAATVLAELGIETCRSSRSPRAATATPGARPSSWPAASPSCCRTATRCSISSSGCATRRTASPSARTAPGGARRCTRIRSTRSPGSDRAASGRCFAISARRRRSVAPELRT